MTAALAPRHLAKIVLVALVYVATAKGGLALAYENSSVTAIWAPTGIALAVLVLGGPRLWPAIALGAVLANSWTGLTAATVAAIGAGNTLEALAGAYLLRAAGFRPSLQRVRDVLALVLAAVLCTVISATIGVLSLRVGAGLDGARAASVWRTWWLGDVGGVLLVTPVVLVLAAARRPDAVRPGRIVEAVALATAAAVVTAVVFSDTAPLEYLVLPILMWAALRFRQAGAVLVTFAIAAIADGFTVSGLGPFVRTSPDASLLLSQTFLGVGAVVGLVLGAVTIERGGARAALLTARDDLELQVEERTAALERIQGRLLEAHELARLGSWEWDVGADTVTWSEVLYQIYGIDPHEHEATFGGYLERLHPDDRERVTAAIERALAEQCSFAFDERIVRPDGAIRILASRGHVVTGSDGRPERMVGICQDVTESRRAERALRESEERARLIIDAASDAFVSTDAGDRIVEWNAQAGALFGWTREEAVGRELAELLVPERNRARHRASMASFLRTADASWLHRRLEREVLHRDGHEFLTELTISPVLTEDGHTFSTFMHDITDRRRRERYLATEHAVSRALLESRTLDEARPAVLAAIGAGLGWAMGAWWVADREAGTMRCQEFWSHAAGGAQAFERATRRLRCSRGRALPGRAWATGRAQVVPALTQEAEFPRLQAATDAGLTAAIAVPLVSQGEVVAVMEFFATDGLHLGDKLAEMLARLSERVTQYAERKDAEDHLREAEERFRRAFEDAGTGMALIGVGGDEDGRFLEVNDALCASTRYTRDELQEMTITAIVHPEDAGETLELVRRLTNGDMDSLQGESRLLDAEGHVIWTAFSTSVIRDANGRPLYRIAQIQDITERKRFEGQLQYLADHDPVTALFNRRRLGEELARELAAAERYGTGGAVLALDLDNFKYVNDTLGHSAGDQLIADVAEILRGRLRRTDTVARLGGDEFAIVMPHADESQARSLAEDLLAAIRTEAVVTTAKGPRRATASIGIALFPRAPGRLTVEELLVEADIAMYDAKEAGRDQACVYDASSSRQQSLDVRMTWGEQIREALDEGRFTLYAEPIVPLRGGGCARHELLVRMVGRFGDIIPPSAFLPLAERFDLVQEIDQWVVGRAIELLAECQRMGHDVIFDVNLSAKSLGNADLAADIARRLQDTSVDPSRLVFEVTETAAIVNVDRAKQFARHLGELGCGVALDDFGAGFSSFHDLEHLPFDYLKINGELVEGLADSVTNQLVVQAVVSIARGLGKKTIAERVGDEETLGLLRDYGVDFAQGVHLGHPVAVEEIALSPAVAGQGARGT
jgi:diguanylate cyclase (GGDEF)-like protein/PAS domain S-box-containing protein